MDACLVRRDGRLQSGVTMTPNKNISHLITVSRIAGSYQTSELENLATKTVTLFRNSIRCSRLNYVSACLCAKYYNCGHAFL